MKNILLFCICFLLIISANAQFEKGQKMLGGQFSFYDQKTGSSNSTPKIISSGVSDAFAYSSFTNPRTFNSYGLNFSYGDNGENSINKSAGLFYNYTKLEPLAKRFFYTYGGTASINYSEYNNNYAGSGSSNLRRTTPGVSIALGLLYQLNNRFVINSTLLNLASVSYNIDNTEYSPSGNSPYTTKSNSINFYTGLNGFNLYSINFGFIYLLKKK